MRHTYAPRGQTPRQAASAKRNRRVSVIGGLGWSPQTDDVSFHFQLTFESFKTDKIIHFLNHLHQELGRPAIIVWDRLNAHRSAAKHFAQQHPDWFTFEFLPPYSPELNPVEQCWGHTKCHELPNYYAQDVEDLRAAVRQRLSRKRRRHSLLRSFFKHARLNL